MSWNKKLIIFGSLVVLTLFLASCTPKTSQPTQTLDLSLDNKQVDQTDQKEINIMPQKNLQKPTMQIDKNASYSAVLNTSEGKITLKLNAQQTPITVNNFVYLAEEGFYDQTIFHRVIDGFMIQGGDPEGNGTGGPGYRFDDEPFESEYNRGTVAMANAGPNTNGSQFFIMHQDYALPKDYVIFGQVIDGLDVVDSIAQAEVTISPSGERSQPVNPVKIESIEIIKE
jgi:cyclophilin family peptidyl-prolyl cis-trans isomerase